MVASRRWRSAALWALVAAVVGVCLAIGAGAFSAGHSKPASLYQRTLDVAGQYRCPVCASESVAVSDAAEAVEIRALIEGWLKQGDSQGQIRQYLVSDYGNSILEKPPTSGVDTLVWVLPAVAAALGVAGLGFGFARWRRASMASADGALVDAAPAVGPAMGAVSGPAGGSGDRALFEGASVEGASAGRGRVEGARLEGASLEGASLEGASLEGASLQAASLQGASLSAPTPAQGRLFDVGEDEPPAPVVHDDSETSALPAYRRPLYRRAAPVLGAVLVVAAGALWLVDRSSSQRLPGATITGGVTGVDEQLEQAASLASSDPAGALAIYDEVLTTDPDQPVALSAEGWIYAEAGYVAKGEDLLQKAEADDPSYDPPHLYRALVLLEDERKPAAAIKELKWYLAHGPDPTMAKTARTALAEAEASL